MPWPLHLAVHLHPKQTLSALELHWGMTAPDGGGGTTGYEYRQAGTYSWSQKGSSLWGQFYLL